MKTLHAEKFVPFPLGKSSRAGDGAEWENSIKCHAELWNQTQLDPRSSYCCTWSK